MEKKYYANTESVCGCLSKIISPKISKFRSYELFIHGASRTRKMHSAGHAVTSKWEPVCNFHFLTLAGCTPRGTRCAVNINVLLFKCQRLLVQPPKSRQAIQLATTGSKNRFFHVHYIEVRWDGRHNIWAQIKFYLKNKTTPI